MKYSLLIFLFFLIIGALEEDLDRLLDLSRMTPSALDLRRVTIVELGLA